MVHVDGYSGEQKMLNMDNKWYDCYCQIKFSVSQSREIRHLGACSLFVSDPQCLRTVT